MMRALLLSVLLATGASAQTAGFNIVDYGAVADGSTLNTAAIQKALDACGQAGGGIVTVPAGTYLTGTLHLHSRITLSLQAGAVLLGSTRIEDYTPKYLIVGEGLQNVTVSGPGTIDGQGFAFWTKRPSIPKDQQKNLSYGWAPQHAWMRNAMNPGGLMLLDHCSNVSVHDLTLQNSDSWTLHLLACQNASVDGVRIRNRLYGPNTDGVDIQGCEDVQVSNCDIDTGDDAICLKNRSAKIAYPHPCKNITVSHCKLTSPTNGFKIGTESYGDFENIVFRDSTIAAGDPGDPLCTEAAATISPNHYGNALGPEAGIAVESVDGAHIRGVTVQDIIMHGARSPIFIRLGDRGIDPHDKTAKVPTGTIEGVAIDHVVADGASAPSTITGLPGHPVRDIAISNVQITNIGAGTSSLAPLGLSEKETNYPGALMWGPMPAYGLFLRHVDGITLKDWNIANARPDTRLAVIADDVAGWKCEGMTLDSRPSTGPLLLLNEVRDADIQGAIPPHTGTWAMVLGAGSSRIALAPENPGSARQVVSLGKEVPADAVVVREASAGAP